MKAIRFIVCCAVLLAGCDTSQYESVVVAVYPSRQQCGIDKEMRKCGEMAAYLRDTLKIKATRRVVVSAVSADPLPKNDHSLDKIAETLKTAGYTNVRTANFDVK